MTMHSPVALLLRALLALLLLATGVAWAQAHAHTPARWTITAATSQDAGPAPAHVACDTHLSPTLPMASHDSTPRCKQACLALSAGFSAMLPVQAPALRLADGAAEPPQGIHALPTGRVVMPERRPPRTA